jgi:hypothetical protein
MKDIVFSLRYFNVIALAALAAKLTLIDSSLMQRATSTYLAWEQPRTNSNITGMRMPPVILSFANQELQMARFCQYNVPNHWDSRRCSTAARLDGTFNGRHVGTGKRTPTKMKLTSVQPQALVQDRWCLSQPVVWLRGHVLPPCPNHRLRI